jgi:RNA polymerase sigma-70 factor (ECF subfamily)
MRTESAGVRRLADHLLGTARGDARGTDTAGGDRTSEKLLSAAGHGDERAFALLYDRLAPAVLGMVSTVVRDHEQSEEVTQEVFVDLWRTAARYRPDRVSAVTWVMAMAHRRAVDRVRSVQDGARQERAATPGHPRHQSDSEVFERLPANTRRQVGERLQELTDVERESIVLAYYEARTCREMAQTLGVTADTVASRLRTGLRRLRARP